MYLKQGFDSQILFLKDVGDGLKGKYDGDECGGRWNEASEAWNPLIEWPL